MNPRKVFEQALQEKSRIKQAKLILVTIPSGDDSLGKIPEADTKKMQAIDRNIKGLKKDYNMAYEKETQLLAVLSKAQFDVEKAEAKLRKAVSDFNEIAATYDATYYSLIDKK